MRCKSCNTALKSSEIIWLPKLHKHEDLCSKCRDMVYFECVEAGWDVTKSAIYEADFIQDIDDE